MELLKSKRFWSAVVGLVIIIFASINPDLEQHLNSIQDGVIALIGVLIGGFTLVDAIQAFKGVPSKYSR